MNRKDDKEWDVYYYLFIIYYITVKESSSLLQFLEYVLRYSEAPVAANVQCLNLCVFHL